MRLMLLALLAGSCSQHIDLGYQDGGPPDAGQPKDTATFAGTFCTPPPDLLGAPVKVIALVQQSGTMCVLDPPGSTAADTFCGDALAPIASMLQPVPARVAALESLFAKFKDRPEVSVALVPFELNVKRVWPPVTGGGESRFESLSPQSNYDDALTRLTSIASELGTGSDYQGALQYVVDLVSSDIASYEATGQQLTLAQTRYVVLFFGSGSSFPRCAANDFLDAGDYASVAMPELTWPDQAGAGCPSDAGTCYCNDPMADPFNVITGFTPGTDRNQFSQLIALTNQLKALQTTHNVADIKLHAFQLFDQEAVTGCGPICEDIAGTFPGVDPSHFPEAALSVGADLMRALAGSTGGTFTQVTTNAGLASFSLDGINFDSTASQSVDKTFMVRFLSSDPAATGRVVDTDGDGLADASETSSNPNNADSDSDCFDDGFERRHAADGFDPAVKDARGCDPARASTLGCTCADTDGDGLSQYAEAYLHTDENQADTDADGVTDGDEARWGLDPLNAETRDTDGDLVSDGDEIRLGSDPTVADLAYQTAHPLTYRLAASPQSDGSVCYQFNVSGVALVPGQNYFKLMQASAPVDVLSSYPGQWQSACVSLDHTAGAEAVTVNLMSSDFGPASVMSGSVAAYSARCRTP